MGRGRFCLERKCLSCLDDKTFHSSESRSSPPTTSQTFNHLLRHNQRSSPPTTSQTSNHLLHHGQRSSPPTTSQDLQPPRYRRGGGTARRDHAETTPRRCHRAPRPHGRRSLADSSTQRTGDVTPMDRRGLSPWPFLGTAGSNPRSLSTRRRRSCSRRR